MINGREFVAYSYGALSTIQGMPNQLKSVALESIAKESKMSEEDLNKFIKEIQAHLKFTSQKKLDQLEKMMKTGKIPDQESDEDLR